MTLGKSLAGLAAIVGAMTLSPGKVQAQTAFPPVPVWGVTQNTPKIKGALPGIKNDTIYLGTIDQSAGSKFVVPTDRRYSKLIVVNPNEAYEVSFAGMQPEKTIQFEHTPGQRSAASIYDVKTVMGSLNSRNDAIAVMQGQITESSKYCATDCTSPLQLLVPNPSQVIVMERIIKDHPAPAPLPLAPAPLPPPTPQPTPAPVTPPAVYTPPPEKPWHLGWVAGGPMALIGQGGDDRYCPPCEVNGAPEHINSRGHHFNAFGGWAAGAYKSPIISLHALAEGAKGKYKLIGEDCDITDPGATYSRIEGAGLVGIFGDKNTRFGAGLSGHRMAINRGSDLGNRGDVEQGYAINAGAFTKQLTGSVFYSPSYEFRSNLTGMDVKGHALGARADADIPLSGNTDLYLMGSAAKLSADGSVRGTTVDSAGRFSFTPGSEIAATGYRLAAEAQLAFGISRNLQLAAGIGAYSRKLGDDRFSNNFSYITPKVGLRLNF